MDKDFMPSGEDEDTEVVDVDEQPRRINVPT